MSDTHTFQVEVAGRMATVEVKVSGIENEVISIKENYVTKTRFWAVEKLTYGYAAAGGAVIWAVLGPILSSIGA